MRKQRQSFSREFKLEAVRLMEEGKKPPAELARELGLRRNQLYKWKEKTDTPRILSLQKLIFFEKSIYVINNSIPFYTPQFAICVSFPPKGEHVKSRVFGHTLHWRRE